MGTNECSQPASKSSWDSLDFGDINLVLKMDRFRKSAGPRWLNRNNYRCSLLTLYPKTLVWACDIILQNDFMTNDFHRIMETYNAECNIC